jgi:hypothetical protein
VRDGVATLAFGEPDTGIWVAVWDGERTFAATRSQAVPLTLSGAERDGEWRLAGEGAELSVRPAGPALGDERVGFYSQRCRVAGTLPLAGANGTVELPGVRARRPAPAPERLDALRLVLGWFADGTAAVLDAERRAGARGHDQDRVAAALYRAEEPLPVREGRLSMTYTGGRPARVGLELWLESDDEEHSYAQRLAGEVGEAGACGCDGALELELLPLRTHYGGRDGAGALILARRR